MKLARNGSSPSLVQVSQVFGSMACRATESKLRNKTLCLEEKQVVIGDGSERRPQIGQGRLKRTPLFRSNSHT